MLIERVGTRDSLSVNNDDDEMLFVTSDIHEAYTWSTCVFIIKLFEIDWSKADAIELISQSNST